MSTAVAILVVLLVGGALIFSATRASLSVEKGPVFIKWMLVVFACFLLLVSIPVLSGL